MNINTVIGMERPTVIIMHPICYDGNVEKKNEERQRILSCDEIYSRRIDMIQTYR